MQIKGDVCPLSWRVQVYRTVTESRELAAWSPSSAMNLPCDLQSKSLQHCARAPCL